MSVTHGPELPEAGMLQPSLCSPLRSVLARPTSFATVSERQTHPSMELLRLQDLISEWEQVG